MFSTLLYIIAKKKRFPQNKRQNKKNFANLQ